MTPRKGSARFAVLRLGRHVVFGTILEGMKFVREIEKQNGTPPAEDLVKRV